MVKHYTARVVISEVTEPQQAKRNGYGNIVEDAVPRQVDTHTEFVITSASLSSLSREIAKHMTIVAGDRIAPLEGE